MYSLVECPAFGASGSHYSTVPVQLQTGSKQSRGNATSFLQVGIAFKIKETHAYNEQARMHLTTLV
jgi:hypothetical protein